MQGNGRAIQDETGTMSQANGSATRRPRRVTLGLTSGLAILAVLVMVFAPVSSAASASPNALRTFLAPWSGAASTAGTFTMSGCGTGPSYPAFPAFNLTTGKATQSVSTAVKGCAKGPSSSVAFIESGVVGAAPFNTTSGVHHVIVYWTVTVTITLKATPGGTTPGASADTEFLGDAVLDDNTNSSSVSSTNSWFQFNFTSSGTTTWHHTFMIALFINETLVLHHQYSVESFIYGYVDASASKGANSASASINMATLGDMGKLTKITLK
jgi:hypothetical protein